jgi:hypothetical protein
MRTIETTDRWLRNAMTVQDLINAIEDCPRDAKVLFTCDYGDYSHTQQALPVEDANILDERQRLVESAYSHSDMAVESIDEDDDYDEDEDDDENDQEYEAPNVVILR